MRALTDNAGMMYNGRQFRTGSPPLIIDRHISWEILRPFSMGLGLLVLIFIGFSAASQLSAAAQGQLVGFSGTVMASTSGVSGPSNFSHALVRASGMLSWASGSGVVW